MFRFKAKFLVQSASLKSKVHVHDALGNYTTWVNASGPQGDPTEEDIQAVKKRTQLRLNQALDACRGKDHRKFTRTLENLDNLERESYWEFDQDVPEWVNNEYHPTGTSAWSLILSNVGEVLIEVTIVPLDEYSDSDLLLRRRA